MSRWWNEGVPTAGLFAGAVSWMVSTQLSYALVNWVCVSRMGWVTPALALLLTAISLGGGVLSWCAWSYFDAAPSASAGHPWRLLAGVGVLSAVLFALVIASQGFAGLILNGCER